MCFSSLRMQHSHILMKSSCHPEVLPHRVQVALQNLHIVDFPTWHLLVNGWEISRTCIKQLLGKHYTRCAKALPAGAVLRSPVIHVRFDLVLSDLECCSVHCNFPTQLPPCRVLCHSGDPELDPQWPQIRWVLGRNMDDFDWHIKDCIHVWLYRFVMCFCRMMDSI